MTNATLHTQNQAPGEHPCGAVAESLAAAAIVPARKPSAPASSATFDRLFRFVQALKAQEYQHTTTAAELMPAFLRGLAHCEAVSFDIFDTALHRYVDHPMDVFLHLEQHPAFAAHQFPQPVSQLRVKAEGTARDLVHRLIRSYEVNLLEIYQVFCDLCGLPRALAPGLVAAEEEVEIRLCFASPAIRPLYDAARAAGRRVIFVSDTYHDEAFLLRLLQAIGYPVEAKDLFASSTSRKAKQDGELFPIVLAALGIGPHALFHVGDHPVSDYEQPRKLGLTALLHPHKTSRERAVFFSPGEAPKQPGDDTRLSRISTIRGLVHLGQQRAAGHGPGDDFWWRFGYSYVGPLTVGFCQWLEQSLRADGMEHACFLLRDGALLHAVYQELYANDPAACPATAFPSSRRASLLPVLELAPGFALPSLLGGIGARPVREYLERLNVPSSDFAPEAAAVGFHSLDERVDGRFDTPRLMQLLLQKRVMTALINRSRTERSALEAFLTQQGVTAHRRVALVDLGWGGTIHKSLQILLSSFAPQTKLTGYYMATFPEAPHSVVPGLAVRSYLAHRGEPVATYDRILQFLNLFEQVYSSTAGSLLYFRQEPHAAVETRAVAVCQPPDKAEAQCRQLEAMHAAALAFARDFGSCPAVQLSVPMPPLLASEGIFRVITQPTAEEALHLGGLVHCDNLGSASTHVAARARSTTDPAELLEDYRRAHWKQGLLASATPEAAALRNLIWLMTSHGVDHALHAPEGT